MNNYRDEQLKKLSDYLIGNEIVKIEHSDKSECILKFTVNVAGETKEFHILATDLGWDIRGEKNLSEPMKFETDIENVLKMCVEKVDKGYARYKLKKSDNYISFQDEHADDESNDFHILQEVIDASDWKDIFKSEKKLQKFLDSINYNCTIPVLKSKSKGN
jgi:hypothetical protein